MPIRLDDNLSVPLSAASVLWAMSIVSEDLVVAALATLPGALLDRAAGQCHRGGGGYAARTVSVSGALVGAAIGTLIYVCAGWQGWLLLLTSFLCAAVTSRMGLQRKTLLGIAEERGGRRGAGNAIANTGVAAAAAILAALSYGTEAGADRDGGGAGRRARAIPSPARSARRGGRAPGR